jgi:hypothetical protein
MVLVIGLGLCVPVLFDVTLWLAWPLLRRPIEHDPARRYRPRLPWV